MCHLRRQHHLQHGRRWPRLGGGGGRTGDKKGKTREAGRSAPQTHPRAVPALSHSKASLVQGKASRPHTHWPPPPSPNHPSRPGPLLFHPTFQRARVFGISMRFRFTSILFGVSFPSQTHISYVLNIQPETVRPTEKKNSKWGKSRKVLLTDYSLGQ